MAIQLAVSTRNAKLDAVEVDVGASAILELRSGAAPANVAAADTGTMLVSMTLPADWMGAAAAGAKAKAGTWSGTGDAAAGAGTDIGHFRLKTSGGVAKMQGTVTVTGGGGDMTVDNVNVAQNQAVTVTAFTLNEANG
jgi:hypothetical protein